MKVKKKMEKKEEEENNNNNKKKKKKALRLWFFEASVTIYLPTRRHTSISTANV